MPAADTAHAETLWRLGNLVELGLQRHPNPQRLAAMLQAGAALTVDIEDDRVRILLELGTMAERTALATLRGTHTDGDQPPRAPEDVRPLLLIDAPRSVLDPARQG